MRPRNVLLVFLQLLGVALSLVSSIEFFRTNVAIIGWVALGSALATIALAGYIFISYWDRHGGYEVVESANTLQFQDPNGTRVHLVKRQVLRAYRHTTSLKEQNLRVDPNGKIENYLDSLAEKVTEIREGAGYTYVSQLTRRLPLFQKTERVVQLDYVDTFLDPSKETYVVHFGRVTRAIRVDFHFHKNKDCRNLRCEDSYGNDLSKFVKCQGHVCVFSTRNVVLGRSLTFSWDW